MRSDIFIRVVYGQGGKGPASAGMIRFRDQLETIGYSVADDIEWWNPQLIAENFDRLDGPKVMIGYSLGANCLTWVSNRIKKPIDLGVAYDPSNGIPVIMPAPLEEVSSKVKRCLHYKGLWFGVGGASLYGRTVETTKTWTPHPWIDSDGYLHQLTIDALERLEHGKNSRIS